MPYWKQVSTQLYGRNGSSTHTPSPSVGAETSDTSGDVAGNEGVENERQVRAANDECSPLERRDVGDQEGVDLSRISH